ncbi:MAG: zf-HC2 domain-containing protein [Planctomycetes bacterium]|nr:zf-HC2 domain-containing protein [Planctomycetota bacterium]
MNDPLNCTEIRALLVLFVGDDLDAAEAARVARHLSECGPCRAEQARWMATRSKLATLRELPNAPGQGTSPSVWSNVRAELLAEGLIGSARDVGAPPVSSSGAPLHAPVSAFDQSRRKTWVPLAAAAAAVVALTLFILRDRANTPVLDDPSVPKGHVVDGDAVADQTPGLAPGRESVAVPQLVHSPLRKAGAGDEALIQRAEWVDGLLMRPQFTTTNPPTLNLASEELR